MELFCVQLQAIQSIERNKVIWKSAQRPDKIHHCSKTVLQEKQKRLYLSLFMHASYFEQNLSVLCSQLSA